ncbi:MAG: GNAT family N-acetyltransferase [Shimia sp.]
MFCVPGPEGAAQLRLFLLEPAARGRGLGARLLDACLSFARAAGYRRIVLWTHVEHAAACRLYARYGFARQQSAPVEAYGRPMTEVRWARDL